MSKKQNDLSIDKINDNVHAVAIGAEAILPITREEAFAFFEQADDNDFETLGGATYLDWEKYRPGKYVFEFTGMTSWRGADQRTGQLREVPAVKLTDVNGEEFVCAGKLIVDNCQSIQQLPCMIRVVYGGKKRANNGNTYFDLKVQVGKGVLTPNQSGE